MSGSSFRRWVGGVAIGTLALAVPVVLTPVAASAATADLLISEYVEGSGNNKALEVWNGTGAAVDLAAGGYTLQQYSNGSSTPGLTIGLTGTLAAGDAHVLAYTGTTALPADPALLAAADQTSTSAFYNGDDAVVLRKGGASGTILDVFGQIGVDPGTAWGSGATSSVNTTLRRQATICAGDPDGTDAFDPADEWDGFAQDTFDGLGAHTASCDGEPPADEAPAVASVNPADGADGGRDGQPHRDLHRAGGPGHGHHRPGVLGERHGAGHRHRRPDDLHGGPRGGARRRRLLQPGGHRGRRERPGHR